MDVTTLITFILAALIIVLVVAGVLWTAWTGRSAGPRQRFGPEYERAVEESGSRGTGESPLRDREKRHERLELRSLPDEARNRYRDEWQGLQQRFVEVPGQAVRDADQLVTRIMREVGYPVEEFDRRAADISVEHPGLVDKYRSAHRVAVHQEQGQADPEELRGAVTSYRALVDALLEERH